MPDEIEFNDQTKADAANPVTDKTWLFGALEADGPTEDPEPEPIKAPVLAAYVIFNAQVFN